MCQEKEEEEEEDSPALRIVYIKKNKERLITAVNEDNIITNRKIAKTRKQNEKKNNCMDISRDKLTILHVRRHAHGYERDI